MSNNTFFKHTVLLWEISKCNNWSDYYAIISSSGPGQYSIPGLGQDSMKKAYIESTRRGAFGTTSVRIAPITKKGEPELPGPSHYKVSDHVNKPRYKQLSSNFASLSNRLAEPPSIVKVN